MDGQKNPSYCPLSYLGWFPPPNLSAAVNSHLRWVQRTTQDVTYREQPVYHCTCSTCTCTTRSSLPSLPSLLLPTLLSYDFLHPTYQLMLSTAAVYVGCGEYL